MYYTNSCHIPVSLIEDINSTFKHQDDLQCQFTGVTVIHCYLKGAIFGEHAKQIVKSMIEIYRVPYMSLSPISRYCEKHGYIADIVDKCPICKKKLKLYQRITGYGRYGSEKAVVGGGVCPNRGRRAAHKAGKEYRMLHNFNSGALPPVPNRRLQFCPNPFSSY